MNAGKLNLYTLKNSPFHIVLSASFMLSRANTLTHTRTHTLSADGGERGHSISRQVLEEKRERRGMEKRVACSAISSHTEAGLAQTHWHFELITGYSHNPFSVSSLRGY